MIRLLVALLVVSHCLGHQYNVDTTETSTSTDTSSSTDSSSSTTSSPTYSSSSTTSSPTTAPVPETTITSISHNKGDGDDSASITVCFQDIDCAEGISVDMALRIDEDEYDAENGTVSLYGETCCSTHLVNNYAETKGNHSVDINVYKSETLIANGIAEFILPDVSGYQYCSSAGVLSPSNTLLRVDCHEQQGSNLTMLRVDYNVELPFILTSQSASLKYYEYDNFVNYLDKMLSYCIDVDTILYCHDVGNITSETLQNDTLLSKEVLNYDDKSLTLHAIESPTTSPMNPTIFKFEMVSKNKGPSIVPAESDFTDTIVNNFENFDPTAITEYILISKDETTTFQRGSIPGYNLLSYVITSRNLEVSWKKIDEKYSLKCFYEKEEEEFDSVTVHCSSQDCFGYCLSNKDLSTGKVEVTTTDGIQTVTASFPSQVDSEELNLFDVKMNWNETDNYSEIEVCLHQPSDNFNENESGSYEALFFNERNEWQYGKEMKTSNFDGYICMNWITELESEFISVGEEVDVIILKRDVDGRSVLASGNVKLLV